MGIDYYTCDECGEAFPDVENYLVCDEYHYFCESCMDKLDLDYPDKEEEEDLDCPLCKIKCVECGKSKEIGEKTKQCLSCLDWKVDGNSK